MITIPKILKAYRTKKITPLELVTGYLNEIKKSNPALNAFVTINEEKAIADAKNITEFNLPLAGIPIAIKDNFCTKGVRTTASSVVLDNFIPPYESTVTDKLKKAGAILIGKTNMDAWAHGSSTETSDYGPTKNPHDLKRVPGGSSGGSAAAVAAGLAPVAIGSETAGSIRLPAAWCGIYGFKPTFGRVSRYGVIAMGSSLDSPGPLTKSVTDSATLLQVIAGIDKYDATSSDEPVPDYSASVEKKYTIGWSEEYLVKNIDPEIAKQYELTIKLLEKNGHKLKKIKLFDPEYAISVYTILQRAEVSSNLARFDGIRYGNGRNFFRDEAKRRMMLGAFTLSVGYYDAYYLMAQKVRTIILNDFKKAFKEVEIILAPTTPCPALKLGESANNPMFGELMDVLVEPSSIAGLPGANIPVALSKQKLPLGMQIMSPWFTETKLFDLSRQLEKELFFYNFCPKEFYEFKL